MTYQQQSDIHVNQLLDLARKHGRTASLSVFTMVFSFVMALAYASALLNDADVDSRMWIAAMFAGLVVAPIPYIVVYYQEGVSLIRYMLGYDFDGDPVDTGEAEDDAADAEQPVAPAPQPRENPVTSMAKQLEIRLEWYSQVDWAGLSEHVVGGGHMSKVAVEDWVPHRVYTRFSDQTPAIEETFPEAMVRLKLAEEDGIGYMWTDHGKRVFAALYRELVSEDPPAPPQFINRSGHDHQSVTGPVTTVTGRLEDAT